MNCDQDINECLAEPCVNGICSTPEFNSYQCTCESGWEGENCDQDIDECLANPCENGNEI